MEDKNYENIKKRTIIIFLIIFTTICVAIVYNLNKTNLLKKKLKKEKYTEISKNIFSKDINTTNTETNYTYNFNLNIFEKYISNKDNEKRETIGLIYKNNIIDISYTYKDTNGCKLVQTGTYDKKNYKCNIVSKRGDCKSKCDIILKEAKTFFKEKNIIS